MKAKIKHPKKKNVEIMEDIGHPTTVIDEKRLLTNMIKNDDPRRELFQKRIGYSRQLDVAVDAMAATKFSKFIGEYPDHEMRIKGVLLSIKLDPDYVEKDTNTTSLIVIAALEDIKKSIGYVDI